jgi:hypothetical protein
MRGRALVVKVRDGAHVRNKAAHIAVGVDLDGIKHVLEIWVQTTEGDIHALHSAASEVTHGQGMLNRLGVLLDKNKQIQQSGQT